MEMEVIVVFSIVKNVVGHMGVKLQFQVFHEQQCVEKGDATAKTIVQKSRRIHTIAHDKSPI